VAGWRRCDDRARRRPLRTPSQGSSVRVRTMGRPHPCELRPAFRVTRRGLCSRGCMAPLPRGLCPSDSSCLPRCQPVCPPWQEVFQGLATKCDTRTSRRTRCASTPWSRAEL